MRLPLSFSSSMLCLALLAAAPLTSRAGGQGPGLPFLREVDFLADPPIDRVLAEITSSQPGAPAPRFVCVDDPSVECVERRLTGLVPNEDFPIRSPNCPPGINTQSCRPDYIPGAELMAQLSVNTDVLLCSESEAPEYDGQISSPPRFEELGGFSPRFVGQLAPGDGIYSDRGSASHFVESFPEELPELWCARWLLWRNSDSNASAGDYLRFQVSYGYDDVRVWVAYDTRATSVPTWLSSQFQDTGILIGFTDDFRPDGFRLWRSFSRYAGGDFVELGGNKADGAVYPAGVSGSNYIVALTSDSFQKRCRGYSIALTLAGQSVQSTSGSGCYDYDPEGNQYFPSALPPRLEGIGFFAGSGNLVCDQEYITPSSEDPNDPPISGTLRVEQSVLGTTFGGSLDRRKLIEIAQAQRPELLCKPGVGGACTYTPAVALVDPDGTLTRPTRDGSSGALCTIPVRFAKPGDRPAVFLGKPADNIDKGPGPGTSVSLEVPSSSGLVADVDVSFQLSTPFADQVRASLVKEGIVVPLDTRGACNTSDSVTDATFDDEAVAAPPSTCGSLSGRLRPAVALSGLDGLLASGTWELHLQDPFCDPPFDGALCPSDGTDLVAWSLDISTNDCADGVDNDGDSLTDFPEDPGCVSSIDGELGENACDDGIENDNELLATEGRHVIAGPVLNPANGHYYYLLESATWLDSEMRAQALGGHLVTIDDSLENDWVFSTFGDFGSVSRHLWIGLNQFARNQRYEWSSGDPAEYRNWGPDQPNSGFGVEGVAYISPSNGHWFDQCDRAVEGCEYLGSASFNGVVEVSGQGNGDGLIDFPEDPGCTSPTDRSENADCDDGLDNDLDGRVDATHDAGCVGAADGSEAIDFTDGASHVLAAPTDDSITVADAAGGAPTRLRVDSGSAIAGDLLATGTSHVEFVGGALEGRLVARVNARVDIRGGALGTRIEARDFAVIEIVGSGCNWAQGVIAALDGDLECTLADGSSLSIAFLRDADATIRLVPEPEASVAAGGALGVLGAMARRQISRRTPRSCACG